MGSLSNYAEIELLDHLLGNGPYTPAAAVYLGYSTADPLDDGSGLAEPGSGNYSRKAVTFNAAASRAVDNQLVTFDQADGDQGTITHYAVFDAATAGNMLAHGSLSASKHIVSGNTPSIAAAEVEISFSAGAVSDYLANKFLDFMFRNQAFTAPTIYVGLDTTITVDADTGSTVSEPSGNNYARKAHSAWNAAAAGAADNDGAIEFNAPSGSWGSCVFGFLADALTAGNLLVFLDITDQTPDSGDTVTFPDGDFNLTLD
jgi:hypothetical protein